MLIKLHPFNGMAVSRVRLRESWVCERAGLQPAGAGTVESLALHGTYREKIVSLGDAFKNFKSLRSLDLSRNIIISLQGIEYLHSLCFLNLYYNDVASLEEIKHLKHLAQLKTLDLRLNPVTRQDADYRLFVIHIVGTLETLDDRPVRESERKTAKLNFQSKSREMLETESGSPSRSHLYGDRGGAKVHLDFGLSKMTEMGNMNIQEVHSRDYTKGSSPLKYQSEEHQSYLQPQTDFEDDLYITTHLTDPPASSSSLSALRKGFSDISKTYTLPSKPTLTNAHLTAKTTELGRDYKSAWCPEKTVTLNSTPMGMKRSSSLNSLLSPKPSDLYSDQHREDFLSGSELKKRESSPSRSETSSISDVLQQLMDLVDRYWNGSGSLLQNQRFLVPARELLTKLMTSDSAKQISPMGDQLRGSRNSYGPHEDGDSTESVKLKQVKVMEENHFLRSKVYKLENQAARKEGGNLLLSQDDLRQKYEQLSLQVESLQQQLNKTNKLQETVNLLHNSQRSLVCTNEYLLQQLNKISPNTITKTPSLPSPQRMNTNKYQVLESTNVPSLTLPYSTGQYSNPERLSTCPL